MPLTDRTVRFTQPRAKPYFLSDGKRLYLKVSVAGTKTWFYRVQGAQERWKKLGRYPDMSLLEARNRAAESAGRGFVPPTVAEAYRDYLPRLRQHYKRHGDIERRFEADILPKAGARRVDALQRKDVSDLLQAIVARGSRVAANRTLPDVRNFFAYCVERGWIGSSPAAGITRKSVGGRERSTHRSLAEEELVIFIKELLVNRFHLSTRLALGLLLLTGTRTGEVLGVDQVEITRGWWNLPANRTKNGRAHKVYLSPQARNLFTISFWHFGPKPFSTLDRCVLSKAVSRLRVSPPFTPHNLRSTMSTRLTDMGVAPHVTEKMLNHKLEGVFEIYNHAEFLPERRAAWRLWGVYLAKLRRRAREETSLVRSGVVSSSRSSEPGDAGALRPGRPTDRGVAASSGVNTPLLGYKVAF